MHELSKLKLFEEEDLKRTLSGIITNGGIKNIISDILKDSKKIEHTASQSYKHNNGFDKIILDSNNVFGCKLRLHIWWKDCDTLVETTIHNHPWNFASYIIIGSCLMEKYREDYVEGDKYIKSIYPTLAKNAQLDIQVSTNTVILKPIDFIQLNEGMIYSLNYKELHKIIISPNSLPFATLVLQSNHLNDHTNVYSKHTSDFKNPFDVKYYTANEISTILKNLISFLN